MHNGHSKLFKYYIILLIFCLLLCSCNKEQTAGFPEISFQSPYKKQTFNVFDTIRIKGTIKDKNQITSVRVVLMSKELTPVHRAHYFFPDTSEFELDFDYPLDDINLPGGKHFLAVRAENGINFTNNYQEVVLVEALQTLKRLIVLTTPQPGKININSVGTDNLTTELAGIQGDYSGSAVSSANQQLYIAGRNQLNLLAINLQSMEQLWSLPVYQPLPMHSYQCINLDDALYVTFRHDYIRGYNAAGSVVFNSEVEESDAPSRIGSSVDYILADIQKHNIEPPYIKVMHRSTGAEAKRMYTSFRVVEFHPSGKHETIITANNNSNGLIISYKIEQNLLFTEQILPGVIICTYRIDDSNYLIGTSEAILIYNYTLNLLENYLPLAGVKQIIHDYLSNQVYLVFDNEIQIFLYPQKQYQKTLPFSDTILRLHLQYAKKL